MMKKNEKYEKCVLGGIESCFRVNLFENKAIMI